MEFFDVLKTRQSTRKFTGEPVTGEDVSRIILAGNSAPVGSNMYKDIHLTVVQDRGILDSLSEATVKRFANRETLGKILGDMKPEALPETSIRDPFYGAHTILFLSHRNQTLQPGIEFANVACVALAMHLAATELGLGSVFLWGVLESMRETPELDRTHLLKLPECFAPILGLAVGHPEKTLAPREIKADRIAVNYL